CASAAFRAGAGLVRMAVPGSIADAVDRALLEATTIALPETVSGSIDPGAVAQVLYAAMSFDAVVIGPGLGADPRTAEFVRDLISVIELPLVLDADGINAFQGQPELLKRASAPILLTPHAGELARLIDPSADPITTAIAAAEVTGCVVLLKGQPTVIASPSGQVRLCIEGDPSLSTAGTGDVLAGIACALMTKHDLMLAAPSAAWIHGRAGSIAAAHASETGVLASDVVDVIPTVVKELL
ncbi:MAG: NAD(P)H-hydrate dehydratase, partial [Actinomycetota bacterium]